MYTGSFTLIWTLYILHLGIFMKIFRVKSESSMVLYDWTQSNGYVSALYVFIARLGIDTDSEPWRFGGEPGRTINLDGSVYGVASCGIHSENLGHHFISLSDTGRNQTQTSTWVVVFIQTEHYTHIGTEQNWTLIFW